MNIKRLVVGDIQTNCYFLDNEKELVVMDPGGDKELLFLELEKNKSELKYIILTHFHYDHVLVTKEIKEKYPKAQILIHEYEKDFLNHSYDGFKMRFNESIDKRDEVIINISPDKFLRDGDVIFLGKMQFEILLTPGHSKGSICIKGEKVVFSGDTLFADGYGRTDLPGGSEIEMQKSLILLGKIIVPGTTVYPGHGEVFSV